MNRRSFITALAGLPFVGRLFRGVESPAENLPPSHDKNDILHSPGPGNLSFHSGADFPDGLGGSITFSAGNDGKEVLRFCPNGDFVYRGRRVETDVELLQAFRAFLNMTIPGARA